MRNLDQLLFFNFCSDFIYAQLGVRPAKYRMTIYGIMSFFQLNSCSNNFLKEKCQSDATQDKEISMYLLRKLFKNEGFGVIVYGTIK